MLLGFDQPVLKALEATSELTDLLDEDLDIERGGFTWWHTYDLDEVVHTGIMNCLFGLATEVEANPRVAGAGGALEGWLEWARFSRNDRVHRASRSTWS